MAVSESRMPSYNEWTLIQNYSDSNAADIFDFDTGVMSHAYDFYKVFIAFCDTSGLANNMNCRINNISTNTYSTLASSGAKYESTNRWTFFAISGATYANRDFFAEAIIRGSSLAATKNPTFGITGGSVHFSGGVTWFLAMDGGFQTGDIATINRIRVFSDQNAIGKIKLYGMNMS